MHLASGTGWDLMEVDRVHAWCERLKRDTVKYTIGRADVE